MIFFLHLFQNKTFMTTAGFQTADVFHAVQQTALEVY